MTLPFLRTSKRPAAPWWVFIFGIFPPRFDGIYVSREARGTGEGPFRLSLSGDSVSKRCLSASGPFPATVGLGVCLLSLCVLSLCLLGLSGLFLRGHDHYQVAPIQVRLTLDTSELVEVGREPPEEPLSQLGMLDLASAEHDRDLHLVAAAQKALDVAALGVEVVVAYLGPELDLPHVDVDLLLAGGL